MPILDKGEKRVEIDKPLKEKGKGGGTGGKNLTALQG